MSESDNVDVRLRARVRRVLLAGLFLSTLSILVGWSVSMVLLGRGEVDHPAGWFSDKDEMQFRFHEDPVGAWGDAHKVERDVGMGPSLLEFVSLWWSIQGKGIPWVNLGVALLILTPVVRVAVCCRGLARVRDWRLAGLAAATLLLLLACSILPFVGS